MDSLPLEILDTIAGFGGYHGLLYLRRFIDSLTPSRRTDFMIGLGYSVGITHDVIIWKHARKRHRVDGPAVECSDGTKHWFVNGEYHRIDGPAIEWSSGYKEWWVDGKLHRIDGPVIERSDGTKYWYVNGKYHRDDGPSVIYPSGNKEWWINGVRQK